MPRKALFTKTQLIDGALRVIRKSGIEGLSSRSLSKEMHCSTSPIFTVYESFEALKQDVIGHVFDMFDRYVEDCLNCCPAFKEYGRRLISFAQKEPRLFQVLQYRLDQATPVLNHVEEVCMEALMKDYQLSQEQAVLLIDQLRIFGYGLGGEIAFCHRSISDQEVDRYLSMAFYGTMMILKHPEELPHVSNER